ncbi:hypothetical protein BS50DRAFT_377448 [Corynespora cassiicola Philippines]|uniref:Uncharacterized protein n=1 Tax=Corynespora cassiicola Philippines TaxID=1448308 RepID=A0A2T2NNF2_CORCC|nr:hypothetical protein BS50DRAFT_377448 [Corynespora cassiicola Philippines]
MARSSGRHSRRSLAGGVDAAGTGVTHQRHDKEPCHGGMTVAVTVAVAIASYRIASHRSLDAPPQRASSPEVGAAAVERTALLQSLQKPACWTAAPVYGSDRQRHDGYTGPGRPWHPSPLRVGSLLIHTEVTVTLARWVSGAAKWAPGSPSRLVALALASLRCFFRRVDRHHDRSGGKRSLCQRGATRPLHSYHRTPDTPEKTRPRRRLDGDAALVLAMPPRTEARSRKIAAAAR